MSKKNILLVEDDVELAELIQDYLSSEQYAVAWTDNGLDAVTQITQLQPDLVILDYMLPGLNGLQVCQQVSSRYHGAILMLTAKDDDMLEVASLNQGAIGFLSKPVRPHILLAHIKAHLRAADNTAHNEASDTSPNQTASSEKFHVQQLMLDGNAFRATLDQQDLSLTSAEFELLLLLAQNAGQALSRDVITQSLRGLEYDGLDRAIDMRISSLRRKLGDEEPPYQYIKTVRGKGYMLAQS